ncbi:hypothetical protein BMS3Abin14_00958 [bacterium BMS3Abin14]|nr:hypothetical protein BMS3Abin14_00958 [bacterium BMS3Abin14]
MRRLSAVGMGFALSLLLLSGTAVAGTYSMSLLQDPMVVMGDSTASLALSITNTSGGGGASIGWIRIDVDPTIYYVSNSNTAPVGWNVRRIWNAGAGQSYIIYEAISGGIPPNGSVVFNLVVTGANDGPFPADVNDMTDAFDRVDVRTSSSRRAERFTGTPPTWKRYGLKIQLFAAPSALGTGQNIGVSAAVTNRTTVTQMQVSPGSLSLSGSGSAIYSTGPVPPNSDLAPGNLQVFSYNYTSGLSGTVVFSGSAADGTTGMATSPTGRSNTVIIGDFTAIMALVPLKVADGQQVTATMTLTNNGTDYIASVVPSVTTSGTAGLAIVSGPTPSLIGAMAPGTNQEIRWVYTATGNVGDTYRLSGRATSSTLTSIPDPAVSPWGVISAYSAVVSPDIVASGAVNLSLVFTVFNNGSYPLREVTIDTPAGWNLQTASGPPGWSANTFGNPVTALFFTWGSTIPVGGSGSFTLTFSSIPTVSNPAKFNFLVSMWDTRTWPFSPSTGAVETSVTVNPYSITLSSTPLAPPSLIADGTQSYAIVATVNGPSGPVAGAPILFTTTAGSLASGAPVTDASGQALNSLTGPLSSSSVTATVTAQYLGATANIVLTFDPYTGLLLDYLPGTMGPTSVSPGDASVVFVLDVINTGTTTVPGLASSTSFSFSDTGAGGTSTFTALLDNSNPTFIAPGATATLTFLARNVDSAFLSGSYFPVLFLDDGFSTPGTRPVTDPVTVSGGVAPITIIRWRESIQ